MKKVKKFLLITSLTAMALSGVVVINSPEEEFPPFSSKL
ncbi:hypothetical protein DET59_101460 [Rossellomorea aquimaris]|jgi:hypothetical protein|uniref:Cyclic lactone autoinducer peptide n=1 Tax=Rossellomorea aquimaris TaxID=189382 RepID=A0A366F0D3_9BACI|nr:hypothetical protein DET59_101460 [Rossellomorea aquimaris]